MGGGQKVLTNLKYHLVDSTGILAESTPAFAAFEVGLTGMSDEVSINARVIAAGATYFLGMGWAYAKGRDLSRKLFKVKETTKERIQFLHDSAYLGTFNIAIAPIIYLAAGARDPLEIAVATSASVGLGLVNGAPMGYAVDLFRDLTGLKTCERPSYPKSFKKLGSKTKKGLVALLTAGAIALTAGIYGLTSEDSSQEVTLNNSSVEIVAPRYEDGGLQEIVNHNTINDVSKRASF